MEPATMTSSMGRPSGPPTKRVDLELEERQIAAIMAIRAVANFGKPPFVVVVRDAIDEYIVSAPTRMSPEKRAEYERILRTERKVVGLPSHPARKKK